MVHLLILDKDESIDENNKYKYVFNDEIKARNICLKSCLLTSIQNYKKLYIRSNLSIVSQERNIIGTSHKDRFSNVIGVLTNPNFIGYQDKETSTSINSTANTYLVNETNNNKLIKANIIRIKDSGGDGNYNAGDDYEIFFESDDNITIKVISVNLSNNDELTIFEYDGLNDYVVYNKKGTTASNDMIYTTNKKISVHFKSNSQGQNAGFDIVAYRSDATIDATNSISTHNANNNVVINYSIISPTLFKYHTGIDSIRNIDIGFYSSVSDLTPISVEDFLIVFEID